MIRTATRLVWRVSLTAAAIHVALLYLLGDITPPHRKGNQ